MTRWKMSPYLELAGVPMRSRRCGTGIASVAYFGDRCASLSHAIIGRLSSSASRWPRGLRPTPPCLVADEPNVNLDAATATNCRSAFFTKRDAVALA